MYICVLSCFNVILKSSLKAVSLKNVCDIYMTLFYVSGTVPELQDYKRRRRKDDIDYDSDSSSSCSSV